MSTKNTRSGGKYSGNHTTVTPSAGDICNIANKCEFVTKISPGFIKSGLRPPKGNLRVKIKNLGSALFVSVRGNTTQQEIAIYSTDQEKTKSYIEEKAKKKGYAVSA
ncbi:MAG: hypothetical protein ACI9GH_000100 [Candidatus Paceibacteria bacterium]|jgi:hypothetical protein